MRNKANLLSQKYPQGDGLEGGYGLGQEGCGGHSKLQSKGCHSPKVHSGHKERKESVVGLPVAL